jgi:uncharacterized protein YjiS (DUF1127 family)
MIMSTLSETAARRESVAAGVVAAMMALMKRSLIAYVARRAEHAAIAHLRSMSERELRDIGLTRAEIPFAVTTGRPRDRTLRIHF